MGLDNELFDRAFDAAEAKLADTDTSTEVTKTPTEETVETPTETSTEEKALVEETKETRTRDESGRFVKGSKSTKSVEPTEQISNDQVAEVSTQEAVEETQSPIEAPPFWSAEHKAIFAKAPRDVQEAFSHYDAQRNEYVNRLAGEAQRGKHYEKRAQEVFEPYKLKIQAQGCKDEFEAASRLLAWNELFEKDPRAAISDLMRKNGLTPNDFAEDGNAQYQSQEFVDPRVQEAIERAERAEKSIEEFKQLQEQQRLSSEIESFKDGVDSLGQNRRQFAEMYAPQISNALERIQSTYPNVSFNEALSHAYEYVLSEARKAFGVNGTSKPVATKKPETVIANAKKAQAAASSVTGAPSSGTSVSRPRAKNIDEALDRALERAGI